MKRGQPISRRGFTLIELTLAIMIGLATASMTLLLMNQQLAFLRIYKAQDFLVREAPLINSYVTKVLGSAEGYRLYTDIDSLKGGGNPVLTGAKVLVLRYRLPSGGIKAAVLSFEDPGDDFDRGLYYRLLPDSGNIGTPEWAITKEPVDVTFSIEQGILRMRLTGPNGETITYSGTEQ
ncbi:prepilin-type N-terminal cleavage/methylation domain-containing protein [Haloferula luteola]|uniref:Prepilin-type N-terminal cleavage/methylation domain-containing protein n=1 Tax=Haloferula luteola TaxID=595692 RepID=A0A840VL71_9BACT|nr:prepilin-type N-terminal cleavage/methylation domain-containing protein [Haloferula luteola]MBB5353391.1 prepilin-type N-terminal cleavage/methylation domain-containing protein [Haloferula luteola]